MIRRKGILLQRSGPLHAASSRSFDASMRDVLKIIEITDQFGPDARCEKIYNIVNIADEKREFGVAADHAPNRPMLRSCASPVLRSCASPVLRSCASPVLRSCISQESEAMLPPVAIRIEIRDGIRAGYEIHSNGNVYACTPMDCGPLLPPNQLLCQFIPNARIQISTDWNYVHLVRDIAPKFP